MSQIRNLPLPSHRSFLVCRIKIVDGTSYRSGEAFGGTWNEKKIYILFFHEVHHYSSVFSFSLCRPKHHLGEALGSTWNETNIFYYQRFRQLLSGFFWEILYCLLDKFHVSSELWAPPLNAKIFEAPPLPYPLMTSHSVKCPSDLEKFRPLLLYITSGK